MKTLTRPVHYISGYRIAQARRNCEFFFGSFFESCDLDETCRMFIIKLKKTVKVKNENGEITTERISDHVDIDRFKRFWGPQWVLKYEASVLA